MLNLVVIQSDDLPAAREFYEFIGLSFVEHAHGQGRKHLCSEKDGMVFEIYPQELGQSNGTYIRLGFLVDDVDKIWEDIEKHTGGRQTISKPKMTEWGYRGVVCDPDGRKIELLQKTSS
jgi:predicted enzyme related to lactoylglutathione lyase